MVLNSRFKFLNGRELFRSLRNARNEWRSKTPMQKWCYFYSIGKLPYVLIRLPLLNDINRVHWFAYFPFVYFITTILLAIYTVSYYAYHGEPKNGIQSTCLATICIGHFPLGLTLVMKTRFLLQSLIDFGGRNIYHDNHEKTEHNRICSDHMDTTMRRFIIKMGIIFMSFSFAFVGPLHAYFAYGIKTTTPAAKIPFIKPKSDAEFLGNLLLQSIVGGHGILHYFGMEVFSSILESIVTISPRLMKSELKRTIQLYEENSISELELRSRIDNFVKQSTDADNFIACCSKLFLWRNLFTPVAFTFSMGASIYSQMAAGFAAGYGMAGMCWVQLFFICDLGETIQDNGSAEMLYAVKWEVLPVDIQRVIMLLIHRKQNEKGLSLGTFGMGINRESFNALTNKVYTLVMFLNSV